MNHVFCNRVKVTKIINVNYFSPQKTNTKRLKKKKKAYCRSEGKNVHVVLSMPILLTLLNNNIVPRHITALTLQGLIVMKMSQ